MTAARRLSRRENEEWHLKAAAWRLKAWLKTCNLSLFIRQPLFENIEMAACLKHRNIY